MEFLSMLLYITDGKVILKIAKMILESGIDGTKEEFERLPGHIAEAESHAQCGWADYRQMLMIWLRTMTLF